MKKTLKFIVFSGILLMFIPLSAIGQEKKLVWDYPVKPGSEEWRMTSYAEKVEKSQPPKELLDSWDTETLFQHCINYPFNGVVFMFNNPNDGFKRVYEQSTVWKEFIQRKDAVKIIVQYIKDRPYKQLFEKENVGRELFTLFFLEKVVSETDFTVYLDSSGKRRLANTILQSHQSKRDFPNEFFGFPYHSSLAALVKVLESDQEVFSDDEVSLTELRKNSFFDSEKESIIISKTINYINKE